MGVINLNHSSVLKNTTAKSFAKPAEPVADTPRPSAVVNISDEEHSPSFQGSLIGEAIEFVAQVGVSALHDAA